VTRAAQAAASPTVLQKLLLIGFGLAVLAACVGLVELALRLSGAGEPHLYEDPFVGFSGSRDLFVRTTSDGGNAVYETSPEKLAFFNHQQFPADKEPGTYRIFALGGSTTAGRPYDAEFAFPAWLQRYLDQAAPSRRFEVINAGGISYASYRVAVLMRELLRYQPDLFVVYTGHNEFLEERTYSELIHQSPLLKSLRLRLNGLRSYTLARHAVRKLKGSSADLPTTLDANVATRLDSWRGLELYERDDELRASIVAHFEYNLRQMTAIAADAGVQLLFIKPVSNIKDFSPFKSQHRDDIEPLARQEIAGSLEESQRLLAADRPDESCSLLERAVATDPEYAQTHFQLGQCLLALERHGEARAAFLLAKELDIAPLRALEVQVDLVESIASERGLPFIDLETILEADSRRRFGHTILGSDYLLDHVHPDIPVHSLIAEQVLDWLASQGIASVAADWSITAREEIFQRVIASMDERYYAERDLNLAKVLGWAGKLEEAESPLRRAAAILTENPEVHLNLGIVLQRTGRLAEATTELERALEIDPQSPATLFNLGVAYSASGKLSAAVESLQAAIGLRPEYPEALFNLGLVHASLGRWQESVDALSRALELRPGAVEIHRNLASAHRHLGRFDEALVLLDQALQIDPQDAEAHTERGITLAQKGEPEKAVETLERALELDPHHAEAHFNLGVVRASQGLLEDAARAYVEALASDPVHTRALNNLGILMARTGNPVEAENRLQRAIELEPSYADAHFNLGIVYDSTGRPGLAIATIERALELDPENGRYHQALAMLLSAQQQPERAGYHLDRARAAGVDTPDR
jgi:Flp pilus assembly protein TadD